MLIGTLIWLSVLAALVMNIQPMFLGVLAEAFSLQGAQIGFIGAAELAGTCLASLTASYWFPRFPLRKVALGAVVAAVLGNLVTGFVDDYPGLMAVRFLTGFMGSGVLYALALGLIGQQRNPDRVIALVIVFQVLSLAVGMSSIPMIVDQWQFNGMTIGLALLFATGLMFLPLLPERSLSVTSPMGVKTTTLGLSLGLLASLVVFSAALGGLWAFMERIGSSAGFSMSEIGGALAVSGLLGGLGALLAAILNIRLGRLLPIVSALSLQLLACFLLATRTDWISYCVAVALFNFCWNLITPYLMGAIAVSDLSGRFMVLIPAAQAAGFAIGPAATGALMVGDDFQLAAWISMGMFALCLVMVTPLLRNSTFSRI